MLEFQSVRGMFISEFNSFMTYLLPGEFSPLTWPACSLTTVADVAILTLFNFILPALGER